MSTEATLGVWRRVLGVTPLGFTTPFVKPFGPLLPLWWPLTCTGLLGVEASVLAAVLKSQPLAER